MMTSSSKIDSISTILAKPNKTSNDLQQIVNQWHEDLLKNEEYLLQYAEQLDKKQQTLNQTTETIIETGDLLSNLEKNLQEFESSIEILKKNNNELETNLTQLDNDSKDLLPNILSNLKTGHDRQITYELMDSVDNQLNELDQIMKELNHKFQKDKDKSILKTTEDLQTCFDDIQNLQDSINQIKF